MKIIPLIILLLCVLCVSCGDDSPSSGSGATGDDDDVHDDDTASPDDDNDSDDDDDDDTSPPLFDGSLALDFTRIKPGNSFKAVITALNASGDPAPNLNLNVTSTRGAVGLITDFGDGVYECVVAPDELGTGQYAVTASVDQISAGGTALVLDYVNDRWDQPRVIDGLVNTPGWEDSAAITPDGQWLFIAYITVSFDCSFTMTPEDPHCAKAVGPWTAPERPDMPGAERISEDGQIHHGCPTTGLDPMPFAVPPMALYGFHRQADGVFGDPFAIYYDGMDGCVSVYGPTFLPPDQSNVTTVFAHDDPHDIGVAVYTGSDLYVVDLPLGQKTILGTYRKDGGGVVLDNALPERLGMDPAGHQGNAHLYYDQSGVVRQIWLDDESVDDDERRIYAYLLDGEFPAGPWSDRLILPSPINSDGVEEIQPIFDGGEVLVRRGDDIVSFAYTGSDIFDSLSWDSEVIELSCGGWGDMQPGSIITLGEPTKAVVDGREELYFVYGLIAPDGTIDLNVGWTRENAE